MNEAAVKEVKALLNILTECLASFREDFKSLDCNSSQAVIKSILFKLEKTIQCAKSILKICKSLKKESIPCIGCFSTSVDDKPSKQPDEHKP